MKFNCDGDQEITVKRLLYFSIRLLSVGVTLELLRTSAAWIFRSSKVCWQTTLLMHSCGPLHFQSTLGMSPITHMYNLLFQLETLYALNFVANNFYHVVMSQLSKIYHSNCKN